MAASTPAVKEWASESRAERREEVDIGGSSTTARAHAGSRDGARQPHRAESEYEAGILRRGLRGTQKANPPRAARRAFHWRRARGSTPGGDIAAGMGLAMDADTSISSARIGDRMLLIVLLVLLVLGIGGGGWGHSRYGYAGWSPAGVILLVLAVLFFTGRL